MSKIELPIIDPTSSPRPTSAEKEPTQPTKLGSPFERITLDIEGMHCASCVGRVERALSGVPGVRTARANLTLNQATVEADSLTKPDDLFVAVARSGYRASLAMTGADAGGEFDRRVEQELSLWRRRVLIASSLLVPLVILHFFAHPWPLKFWLETALATVMQFYVGWPYYVGAARRLIHLSANMDTLIALGTTAAYGTGIAEVFWRVGHADHGMAFVDAGLILAFITLGRYLEVKAKGSASAAIRKLLDLSPPEAFVQRDGRVIAVSPSQVKVGETIVVRPGEKVPLDARIVSGHSAVDQSWLTGESIPVERSSGDEILAGTINGQGALTAVVTRTADNTSLSQVIELVRRAQESKAEVQRLADRVVAWFVPVVLLFAAATLLGWRFYDGDWKTGISSFVAVLVIACPCALGLATPTAIMVASGRGAELGIFIKDAAALEIAGRLTTVVFDKTGTITVGQPRIHQVVVTPGHTDSEVLRLAAAAEQLSAHPLAAPIIKAAAATGAVPPLASKLEVLPGRGIRAEVENHSIVVGNELLMRELGVSPSEAVEQAVEDARRGGKTPLLVARNLQVLGVIVVADSVAPHSAEAIQSLKRLGLEVWLLSGDLRTTAEAIAREVGIDRVQAEVRPDEKQRFVQQLHEQGKIVAMVGDGINDAPALAAADLGIAMGSGSDIAIEAADVVIVGQDLRGVPRAVSLANSTLRTIRQNLVWAFLYNVLLLPLAAGILVPWGVPRIPAAAAAAAMALSSVSVVSNSLLLRLKRL